MAEPLQSVRGMRDLLPPESAKWHFFERRAAAIFENYGYAEIRIPIVEPTELFSRGIGEATDIVEKEMYTFKDRSDRSLTMRPEGTASCARAYIQHSIHKSEPVTRWYYTGPMFRYERMQTGRYRQFYQMGCEAFGVAEPTVEAEQIAMLCHLYRDVGLANLDVRINSVGNRDDRPLYRKALVDFLTPLKGQLCKDCQRRLASNPLRVLDCKVERCREAVADAPLAVDHLSAASAAHFEGAQSALDALGVDYTVDPRIVRGLDYYTGTVFEILGGAAELGTQSTIVAGGRYDNLVESLGGPSIPGVGFALGVERAVLSLGGDDADYTPRPDAFVVTRGAAARARGLALTQELRERGLRVEIDHREVGFKAQFKRADKLRARRVITIGDSELESGSARVKDMDQRSESDVAFEALTDALQA